MHCDWQWKRMHRTQEFWHKIDRSCQPITPTIPTTVCVSCCTPPLNLALITVNNLATRLCIFLIRRYPTFVESLQT